LPLAHLDLYRLETSDQIIGAGLEDYFYKPPGVAVIEWCERWPDFVPQNTRPASGGFRRRVQIEPLGETERRITYEDSGA